MKIVKKIVLVILAVLVLGMLGAYVYFDRKFTPEKNYLTVSYESGNVPFSWVGPEKTALLLPVHFANDTVTYYLQFDTGSASTVLYSGAIDGLKQIGTNGQRAQATFYIGKTKIASDKFKVLKIGGAEAKNDTLKIIGTLGADLLENRKTVIDFTQNHIALNLAKAPTQFQDHLFDFQFKKRKIIIAGLLNGNPEKFLFDSGTSAYELLTDKAIWEKLKRPDSEVTVEKSEQSWDKILTTYTANCNQNILLGDKPLQLAQVTYVAGFSQMQYAMMKFSGMTGMLGNKIFLGHCLYIDGAANKMGID